MSGSEWVHKGEVQILGGLLTACEALVKGARDSVNKADLREYLSRKSQGLKAVEKLRRTAPPGGAVVPPTALDSLQRLLGDLNNTLTYVTTLNDGLRGSSSYASSVGLSPGRPPLGGPDRRRLSEVMGWAASPAKTPAAPATLVDSLSEAEHVAVDLDAAIRSVCERLASSARLRIDAETKITTLEAELSAAVSSRDEAVADLQERIQYKSSQAAAEMEALKARQQEQMDHLSEMFKRQLDAKTAELDELKARSGLTLQRAEGRYVEQMQRLEIENSTLKEQLDKASRNEAELLAELSELQRSLETRVQRVREDVSHQASSLLESQKFGVEQEILELRTGLEKERTIARNAFLFVSKIAGLLNVSIPNSGQPASDFGVVVDAVVDVVAERDRLRGRVDVLDAQNKHLSQALVDVHKLSVGGGGGGVGGVSGRVGEYGYEAAPALIPSSYADRWASSPARRPSSPHDISLDFSPVVDARSRAGARGRHVGRSARSPSPSHTLTRAALDKRLSYLEASLGGGVGGGGGGGVRDWRE